MLKNAKTSGENMKTAAWDFMQKIKDRYGEDFSKVAPRVCADKNNIVGEGASKYVFKIDGADDYLLALIKKEYNPKSAPTQFTACDIPLPEYNFGQALLDNGKGLMVMKKSNGVPHSLSRWVVCCARVCGNHGPMRREDARKALYKIREIANMPMEAFNHFTRQVKYLGENSLPLDTVNPNNVLVDKKNQRLNMIDVLDGPKYLQQLPKPMNGVRNIEAVLLDSILHCEYLKVLSPKEQNIMKDASRIVIAKCQKAARNVGLINDQNNVQKYFELLIENTRGFKSEIRSKFLRNYLTFTALYKDELAKEKGIKVKQAVVDKDGVDYLQLKMDALRQMLGDKVGKTADAETGKRTAEHLEIAQTQTDISEVFIKARRASKGVDSNS